MSSYFLTPYIIIRVVWLWERLPNELIRSMKVTFAQTQKRSVRTVILLIICWSGRDGSEDKSVSCSCRAISVHDTQIGQLQIQGSPHPLLASMSTHTHAHVSPHLYNELLQVFCHSPECMSIVVLFPAAITRCCFGLCLVNVTARADQSIANQVRVLATELLTLSKED